MNLEIFLRSCFWIFSFSRPCARNGPSEKLLDGRAGGTDENADGYGRKVVLYLTVNRLQKGGDAEPGNQTLVFQKMTLAIIRSIPTFEADCLPSLLRQCRCRTTPLPRSALQRHIRQWSSASAELMTGVSSSSTTRRQRDYEFELSRQTIFRNEYTSMISNPFFRIH